MADYRSLVIVNGGWTGIPNGDNLVVGSGIKTLSGNLLIEAEGDLISLGNAITLKSLDNTARDALGAVANGTTFYNGDLDRVQYIINSAWVTVMADETSVKIQDLVLGKFDTPAASTSDECAGGDFYEPARFTLTNSRQIIFEAVLFSSDGNPVRVKLYSRANAAFVTNLDGLSHDYIETSAQSPTRVVSPNLNGVGSDNFDEESSSVYEVFLQSTDAGTTATLYSARLVNTP